MLKYMLDVPMYFVFRDGKYIDAAGQSFRDFLKGQLPALPGERPYMSDWIDHLSTAFPEVRLKKLPRNARADGGPWNRICALPAFWVGLLYDQTALDAAWDLVKDWDMEGREALRNAVPKLALGCPLTGRRQASRTLPAKCSISHVLALPRGQGSTRRATMRPVISPRSTRSSLPARFRPSAYSTGSTGNGAGTSPGFTRK